MMMSGDEGETFANPDVLEFYRQLPFNYRQSARDQAKDRRRSSAIARYPMLLPLLRKGTTVLDVGCGAGWFSLDAAYHYGCDVTGIDFNTVAIERAREIGKILGTSARFHTADLFTFESPVRYDVVSSIGVLHHTNNCLAALSRLGTHYVKPGGHVFVGLYHLYGRRPFLDHFRQMKERGASEAEMLERYKRLDSTIVRRGDETFVLSWFRDQVLHPHETQHTLREMIPVLDAAGLTLVSTSINGFANFAGTDELFAAEAKLEQVAIDRLAKNTYFPGFFVILAKRTSP